jgi:hypothetical protein
MTAKTGSGHSNYVGLLPVEPSGDLFRPIDLKPKDVSFPNWAPSASKRARSLARFLIAFCAGVATAWLWLSHGDAARERIANLFPQLGWLAPRTALTAQNPHAADVIALAASAAPLAEQPNAMSFDFDVVGQNVKKIDTPTAAGQEPRTRSTDQMSIGQGQMTRDTDQTATSIDQAPSKATRITVESRPEGASLQQPTERFDRKPTDARPPQTLSERGKQLSAASRHDASCFPSASAVLQNHPAGSPIWTLRAPGHEGTMCWYAAARPRTSERRSRAGDHRMEMTPRDNETVETTLTPAAPYGRGGSWEGGQPY